MHTALFITCLTDTFYPRVGEACVRVLRHFGCDVTFPCEQTCCGQPAYNSGCAPDARAVAQRHITVFEPCETIVSPSASCVTMVRHHYPELFATSDHWRHRAEQVGQRTFEITDFLTRQLGVDLPTHLRSTTPLTYHFPCHARTIYSAETLEAWLAGPRVTLRPPATPDLCCGFGGAFAVDLPELSTAMLDDKLNELIATGAPVVVCNEGGCGLHLGGAARRRNLNLRFTHVVELLAESLGLLEPAA
jgi:L-lactate dehydrogenase complex protein LldE